MNTPRIGTPLSRSATRVMLLGAGELGKEVVIAFQRLGVEVIAVDRYHNAPGHQVAHHGFVMDMTDQAALLALIEDQRPDYVVPEIEAIATGALLEVDKRGISEVIPTARATALTMNREGIRRLADEELGLPTSAYAFADSREQLAVAAATVGYPCLVKPTMSSSGKGQSTLRGPADLDAAWETAASGARVSGGRVIVEGFVDFDYEITLLTVRAIDPATGRLTTHFCAPIGHRQERGDYVESWQPQPMSQVAHGAAMSIAARIASALGDGKLGGRGVFGVEMFVKGDDVYFSEVSPRPHDTGLVTLGTQRLSEFEMHARAILGLPVDVTLASPGASAVIYGGRDEPAIAFENVAAALAVPETDIRLFGKPESYTRRRMGVVIATADDTDSARRRAVDAARLVRPVSTAVPAPVAAVPAPVPAVPAPVAAAPAPPSDRVRVDKPASSAPDAPAGAAPSGPASGPISLARSQGPSTDRIWVQIADDIEAAAAAADAPVEAPIEPADGPRVETAAVDIAEMPLPSTSDDSEPDSGTAPPNAEPEPESEAATPKAAASEDDSAPPASAAASDGVTPDAGAADAGAPDASVPDVGVADAASASGSPDAAVEDSAQTGEPDDVPSGRIVAAEK
ncbi:formate-dependent phosphoribosylglycinamide formyltransferase [Williamsia sp. CHRR-6]|nr:formate-dependent phosphoribosylglycinamide formyltransferase [Williamsia sp. CHRR-6]MBT0566177.1 formate-dependent phosphoribosylglycinamide formyltransferase [Williamsia sp. CHRR-6]